jgi:hypothetical protein
VFVFEDFSQTSLIFVSKARLSGTVSQSDGKIRLTLRLLPKERYVSARESFLKGEARYS